MNRVKIKNESRELLKGNLWNILKPMLIIGAIVFAFGLILGISSGMNIEENASSSLITVLLEAAMYPLTFGYLVYEVKLVRKESYDINLLFAYYKKFWPIFALNFLIGLFVGLWALLFIIPGIIASYKYAMALLIMVDGEDDPMECIKKSKAMMNGYKWDFFVFRLSFFWWHLLGIITFGIAYIYVGPYITVAEIKYYEELKKATANN